METRSEKSFVSFVSTHPGAVLKDWLEETGVKQKDFAATIGIPATRLNELIKGKRAMTEDLAKRVSEALGNEASFWLRLQVDYEYNERMLSLRTKEEKESDNKENMLSSIFNLKELYKYLEINHVSSIRRTEILFEILGADCEELSQRASIVGCFKHSDTLRIDERNMRTWVLLAQYEASKIVTDGEYRDGSADRAAWEISQKANDGTLKESDIKSILSRNGIAYTSVANLKSCPVDAYSVMQENCPAIVVTHRHNNMQKLIFDVLHEIGHIVKHMHGTNVDFLNVEYSQNNPIENEANVYAQDMLISPEVWKNIMRITLDSVKPDYILRKIGEQAKLFGINPYIAVARYKHDSRIYKGRTYSPTPIL